MMDDHDEVYAIDEEQYIPYRLARRLFIIGLLSGAAVGMGGALLMVLIIRVVLRLY